MEILEKDKIKGISFSKLRQDNWRGLSGISQNYISFFRLKFVLVTKNVNDRSFLSRYSNAFCMMLFA